MTTPERCILLFARQPLEEGAAKRMRWARPLFESARRRIASAAASLRSTDLLVPRQRGSSFGERLANAIRDARDLGYRTIVAVPSDTPALGARHLRAAFEALETRDVVLGPAPDGGVYLIGLGAGVEPESLLHDVRWMTARVLGDLRAAAPEAVVLQERLGDLDRPADLLGLLAERSLDADVAALIRSLLAVAPAGRSRGVPAPRRPAFLPALPLRGPPAPFAA